MLTREAFRRQTAVTSRLKHANIVELLGICSLNEPPRAVLEYARCGDLATFLRSSGSPADTATGDERNVRRALR